MSVTSSRPAGLKSSSAKLDAERSPDVETAEIPTGDTPGDDTPADDTPAQDMEQHDTFGDTEDRSEEDPAADDYSHYRTLSPAAVIGSVLGVGSFAAFLNWWLVALPLAGLAVGIFAMRRIASRSDELAGRAPAIIGVVLSAGCLIGSQVTLWYIRLTEVPEGHVRLSYDDLQPDPRVINQIVPASAEELHGERVFIKGYVLAGNRKDGIRTFILVRDQGDCCFGGNPKLTDRILVHLKPGDAFSYTDKSQKLIGRFQIRPGSAVDVEGNVVYQLEDAEIL
jgi:xanthosine utilization system XapX-like protein